MSRVARWGRNRKTLPSQFGAAFALKQPVQFDLEPMQVKDIGLPRSEAALRSTRRCPSPRFAAAWKSRSPADPCRDLFRPWRSVMVRTRVEAIFAAVDRRRKDAEPVQEDRDIEPAEMEQFQDCRVGQNCAQVRRVGLAACDLHQMAGAVAGRQLHQAKTIPRGIEAHGLRIDRDRSAEAQSVGEVAFVQMDFRCHRHCRQSLFHRSRLGPMLRVGSPQPSDSLKRRPPIRLQAMRPAPLRSSLHGSDWCPGEDSNFHGLAATGT